jgi:hypothetical protein
MTATPDNGHLSYVADELEFVRLNYSSQVEETQRLERYAVVVAAAIWSWCAAASSEIVVKLLIWLPVVSSVLFGLRSWAIGRQIEELRRYLQKVEHYVELPQPLGWERSRSVQSLRVRVATAYAFWAILEFVAVGLAAYVSFWSP